MLPFSIINKYGNNAPIVYIKAIVGSAFNIGVLYNDGRLYLRGSNASYQLGTGDTTNMYSTFVLSRSDVRLYSSFSTNATQSGSIVVTTDNKVFAVGYAGSVGTTSTYQTWTDITSRFSTLDISKIVDINCSGGASVYLLEGGELYGLATVGLILGAGSASTVISPATLLDTGVQKISMNDGNARSLMYIKGNKLYVSGSGSDGRLGTGSSSDVSTRTLVEISGYPYIYEVACNSTYSTVLAAASENSEKVLLCTGSGTGYQSGSDANRTRTVFGTVAGVEGAASISLGSICKLSGYGLCISSLGMFSTGLKSVTGKGTTGTDRHYYAIGEYTPVKSTDHTKVQMLAGTSDTSSWILYEDKIYLSCTSQWGTAYNTYTLIGDPAGRS